MIEDKYFAFGAIGILSLFFFLGFLSFSSNSIQSNDNAKITINFSESNEFKAESMEATFSEEKLMSEEVNLEFSSPENDYMHCTLKCGERK
ncbi:MAG TPA: hypothetical protein VJK05_02050 [archaeon]|nr:hypothetical protein [archaeon]